MSSSSRFRYTSAANLDTMMERLGIDLGCRATPRLGLTFSCALRTCSSCTAREACAEWQAKGPEAPFGPPEFCPNTDLLWELLCDPAFGRRPHGVL
jgi:Family of unknown function (DUF6455)